VCAFSLALSMAWRDVVPSADPPLAGLVWFVPSVVRVYRGMIQIGFAYSQMQGRGALARLGRTGKVVAAPSQSTRTLALLTRVRGTKRGANNRRSRAASGYIQPLPRRPNGTSGDTRHTGPHFESAS
jgi:hypothetical protein